MGSGRAQVSPHPGPGSEPHGLVFAYHSGQGRARWWGRQVSLPLRQLTGQPLTPGPAQSFQRPDLRPQILRQPLLSSLTLSPTHSDIHQMGKNMQQRIAHQIFVFAVINQMFKKKKRKVTLDQKPKGKTLALARNIKEVKIA